MELLERLDLQAPLLAAGTKKAVLGRAFRGDRRLGEASFAGPGFQAGYRLSLPQFDLERILEAALLRACPDCLFRETGIETFQNGIAAVKVRARFGGHHPGAQCGIPGRHGWAPQRGARRGGPCAVDPGRPRRLCPG